MTDAIAWTAAQAVIPLVQVPLRRYRTGSLLAKLIAVLDDIDGMAGRAELAAMTRHPPQSVDSALRQLVAEGAIRRRMDAKTKRWLYGSR